MNLLETVVDALWEGFKAEPNACVDREMDLIDTGGSWETFSMERVAQHVINRLAANKIVDTVEMLEALPIPTPDHLNGVLIKSVCLVDSDNGKYGLGEVYERNTDGTWCMLQDPYGADWGERLVPSKDIPLPAVVLYNPNA